MRMNVDICRPIQCGLSMLGLLVLLVILLLGDLDTCSATPVRGKKKNFLESINQEKKKKLFCISSKISVNVGLMHI